MVDISHERADEPKAGHSFHYRFASVVSKAKHNRLARVLTFPFMNLQYMIRDLRYAGSPSSLKIRSLKGKYAGKRCFIVGNGPSLTTNDLDLLANEISFGSNRIYQLFDSTEWRPTYYIATDREFIAQEAERLMSLECNERFINITPRSASMEGEPGITLINKRPLYYSTKKYTNSNIIFTNRPDHHVTEGYTVTFVALELAMWMGFKDIYLLGMDHRYTSYVDEKGKVRTAKGVESHCYDDPKGAVLNPFNAPGVEYAYSLAQKEAVKKGVHIYNATRGGALEVFERVDLDNVFEEIAKEKVDEREGNHGKNQV